MYVLLSISAAMLAGSLMTRLFKPLKLPDVTAYLIAGVLIGPYCLGRLHIEGLGFTSTADVEELSLVSDLALVAAHFAMPDKLSIAQAITLGPLPQLRHLPRP